MAQFFEDWSGSTIGAAPTGWTLRLAAGTSSPTVETSTDPLAPAGRRLHFPGAASGRRVLTLTAAGSSALASQVRMLVKLTQLGTVSGAGTHMGAAIRVTGADTTDLGARTPGFAHVSGPAFRMTTYQAGTGTSIGSAANWGNAPSYAYDTLYWLEATQTSGSNTALRLAAGNDPTFSTVLYTGNISNSALLTAGEVGLFSFENTTVSIDVLAVGIGTDGDTAPTDDGTSETSVEQDRAVTWNIVADVTADRVIQWNVVNSATQDRAVTWDIAGSVEQDFVSEWIIGAPEVVVDFTVDWELAGTVTQSYAAVWNLGNLSVVSADLDTFWLVYGSASTDLDVAWDLTLPGSAPTWFLRTTDGDPTWSGAAFDVVERLYSVTWSTVNARSRDLVVSFHVSEVGEITGSGSLPDPQVRDFSVLWEVQGDLHSDLDPLWDVLNPVEQDFAATWGSVTAVVADYAPSWSVLNPAGVVARDLVVAWNAIGTAEVSYTAAWHMVHAAQADLVTAWATEGRVEQDLVAVWELGDKVQADLQQVWGILEAAEADYETFWNIVGATYLDPSGPGVFRFEVLGDLSTFEVVGDKASFEVASEAAPELTD